MESWNEKLLTAAEKGDKEALKLCLQNGADIDYRDDDRETALMYWGETALMKAAMEGHLEICRLLIDRGCKIHITNEYGRTALMYAGGEGHLEVCKLLIDRGCKIDISDVDGQTALMKAAYGGRLEICSLLIDGGCKIDTTDTINGYTALHLAAGRGYLQITRCLVEQGGASPLVTTFKGKTPYDLAAEWKYGQYEKVMEYLQTVMSEKSSGVTAGQGMEGNLLWSLRLLSQKARHRLSDPAVAALANFLKALYFRS